jgi:hypothetical protein
MRRCLSRNRRDQKLYLEAETMAALRRGPVRVLSLRANSGILVGYFRFFKQVKPDYPLIWQGIHMRDLEQAIRERAYQLWVIDDRQDGRAEMHWLIAQREVLAASLEGIARVRVSEHLGGSQKTRRKYQAKRSRRAA